MKTVALLFLAGVVLLSPYVIIVMFPPSFALSHPVGERGFGWLLLGALSGLLLIGLAFCAALAALIRPNSPPKN